ncbi:MAG: SpoIIE family protein phosphatase [Bacteriovoracaceae bacterium]|jgi:PPM family protein phosphatase|nr:SpoIIE family protein phosphatase [Bacteriovoracaceae bacterium]
MNQLKSYAARTDQGPYLQVNEDGQDIDLINKLFLIMDGFGGSNVGDETVKVAKETIKKFYTKIGGDPDSTLPFYYSHKYLLEGNALINSMHYAHATIKDMNLDKEMNQRGGASVIGASVADNIMTLVSTGNCLCYLSRRGNLSLVSRPDGQLYLGHDDYEAHFHCAPTSGLGLFEDLHLKVDEIRILKDDLFVFMTDGVYARISEKEIEYIIEKNLASNKKIDEMFELANSRGNLDNQTTIFLQF